MIYMPYLMATPSQSTLMYAFLTLHFNNG
jgi:hypothetical protein